MRTLLRWIMVFVYLKHRDGMPQDMRPISLAGKAEAFAQSF
ncbi:Hypothetical protein GbCGDNIH9_5033 [Granulibacter bethesdensis]|uniref:Uncharacterized protein n=1 Tax=Granulibacter bethesdensis TaxID=364410 RepID=A0AAC9P7X3_9PROT|nr:Hypothetical protein GbCGDNIH9_5033 [Granulibacter bethesdensis]APH61552.1 Hypothetical protein GbCGDNIH8_5033 [Granulibacter bethesdensis]